VLCDPGSNSVVAANGADATRRGRIGFTTRCEVRVPRVLRRRTRVASFPHHDLDVDSVSPACRRKVWYGPHGPRRHPAGPRPSRPAHSLEPPKCSVSRTVPHAGRRRWGNDLSTYLTHIKQKGNQNTRLSLPASGGAATRRAAAAAHVEFRTHDGVPARGVKGLARARALAGLRAGSAPAIPRLRAPRGQGVGTVRPARRSASASPPSKGSTG
jgi:hypothetical protein